MFDGSQQICGRRSNENKLEPFGLHAKCYMVAHGGVSIMLWRYRKVGQS